ncbi:protein ANTAGONIST OF LIKE HETEROCHROMATIN PROTEIN 1 [Elysia marginata]|uniref:Protein ANTAGONIST OF LIKE HETEROCHROMATIN PROTEIN 1 n=1 Tax=Elysia marginata TaxID=1093978 RepID=A0AAV4IQN3_9GAST|nr:protein ANTAGONIST OF LIKE HETEROCHROMATIN PROTEIN 1 [Elysia marginata]
MPFLLWLDHDTRLDDQTRPDVFLPAPPPTLKPEPDGQTTPFCCENGVLQEEFLSTGESFQSLAFRFRLGHETVRVIVKETVQVIWRNLQPQEMPVPDKEAWEQIANGFYERWQFPLCASAVDGKHVQLKAPADSSSQYYNYKGHHSIVLMAICDSKFVVIDVGAYGSSSDGGIFQNSNFFQLLRTKRLHLPDPAKIPNTDIEAPYVFVGDEAFPLIPNLMRPFPQRDLSDEKRIFNYRMSRARKQIECAFGILSSMWRILRKPVEVQVDFATDIVKATCILHNYIQNRESERIKEVGTITDDTNSHLIATTAKSVGRQSEEGKEIRNTFMNYFTSPIGSLPWQTDMLTNLPNLNKFWAMEKQQQQQQQRQQVSSNSKNTF